LGVRDVETIQIYQKKKGENQLYTKEKTYWKFGTRNTITRESGRGTSGRVGRGGRSERLTTAQELGKKKQVLRIVVTLVITGGKVQAEEKKNQKERRTPSVIVLD